MDPGNANRRLPSNRRLFERPQGVSSYPWRLVAANDYDRWEGAFRHVVRGTVHVTGCASEIAFVRNPRG
jgi:hypothetical protein